MSAVKKLRPEEAAQRVLVDILSDENVEKLKMFRIFNISGPDYRFGNRVLFEVYGTPMRGRVTALFKERVYMPLGFEIDERAPEDIPGREWMINYVGGLVKYYLKVTSLQTIRNNTLDCWKLEIGI